MLSYFKPARASFKKGPKVISGKNVTIVEVLTDYSQARLFLITRVLTKIHFFT